MSTPPPTCVLQKPMSPRCYLDLQSPQTSVWLSMHRMCRYIWSTIWHTPQHTSKASVPMSAGNIQTELHTKLAGGFNVSCMGVFCANHHDRKNMQSEFKGSTLCLNSKLSCICLNYLNLTSDVKLCVLHLTLDLNPFWLNKSSAKCRTHARTTWSRNNLK